MSELGIVVDQPSGHHQMACHTLGVLLAEGLQFVSCDAIEVSGDNLVRDYRVVMMSANRPDAEGVAILRGLALAGILVAASWGATLGPEALLIGLASASGSGARLGRSPGAGSRTAAGRALAPGLVLTLRVVHLDVSWIVNAKWPPARCY